MNAPFLSRRSKLRGNHQARIEWRDVYRKARLCWPKEQWTKETQVERATFALKLRKLEQTLRLTEKMLRQIYHSADDPKQPNQFISYLLCGDGTILATRGRTHFLHDVAHEQKPRRHRSLPDLPIELPEDYGMNGITAISAPKHVAIALREISSFLFERFIP